MNRKTIDRFWAKVDKLDSKECWNWKASKRNKGYGAFVWADESGEVVQGRAHRFSWLLHRGTIDHSLCILHKCDNPACVNPDHLFIGTKAENNDDMRRKGRSVAGGTYSRDGYRRGESHQNTKLSDEAIAALRLDREVKKVSYSKLAKKYNICIAHAWRICNGVARR